MKSFKPLLPILLASPFTSAYRWFNWQFQITCQATGFYAPQDEAELVDWVKDRYEDESMIKVVGNGHAFGNLTTCVDRKSLLIPPCLYMDKTLTEEMLKRPLPTGARTSSA